MSLHDSDGLTITVKADLVTFETTARTTPEDIARLAALSSVGEVSLVRGQICVNRDGPGRAVRFVRRP